MVEYREFGSKNRSGGRHQLNLKNKIITHYACPDLGQKCFAYSLKLCLSKLPKAVPLGHNTLSKLKDIFKSAGLGCEKKSNHSLRATAISRMFAEKVPEKVIMEHSGH